MSKHKYVSQEHKKLLHKLQECKEWNEDDDLQIIV